VRDETSILRITRGVPFLRSNISRHRSILAEYRSCACLAELHQQFVGAPHDGMLHLLQFVLYAIQSVDALLEVVRETLEKRGDLGVLEGVEFRNDVIAFFAGFHPVDQALKPVSSQAQIVDALGKHSGEKERVLADVLAHLALAVE